MSVMHGGRGTLGCGPRCPLSQLSTAPPTFPPQYLHLPQPGHTGLLCDPKPVADLLLSQAFGWGLDLSLSLTDLRK